MLGIENSASLPSFSYKSTISFLVLQTLSTALQDWWFPPRRELSSLFITMVYSVNRRGPSTQPWGAPVFSANVVPIQTVWGLFVRKSNIPLQSVSWVRLYLNVLFSSTAFIIKQPFGSHNSRFWLQFHTIPPNDSDSDDSQQNSFLCVSWYIPLDELLMTNTARGQILPLCLHLQIWIPSLLAFKRSFVSLLFLTGRVINSGNTQQVFVAHLNHLFEGHLPLKATLRRTRGSDG